LAAPLSTHGTGCALSAAIAAALAGGCALPEAVASAKGYLYAAISQGRRVGPDAAVMGMPVRFSRQDVQLDAV
jgi:hydroxymethylpyrimidine/phosphomethylpyrimidine kinase